MLNLPDMGEASLSDTKVRILRFAEATKGQGGVIPLILTENENIAASLNGMHCFMQLHALCV